MYIAIQIRNSGLHSLLVTWLLNECLEFNGVNGFVSTILILKTMISVKNPLDRHLKKPGVPGLKVS